MCAAMYICAASEGIVKVTHSHSCTHAQQIRALLCCFLQVLYCFLEEFSSFDWDRYCLSLQGPVPLQTLPSMAGALVELLLPHTPQWSVPPLPLLQNGAP
jgi:hypothetical protein